MQPRRLIGYSSLRSQGGRAQNHRRFELIHELLLPHWWQGTKDGRVLRPTLGEIWIDMVVLFICRLAVPFCPPLMAFTAAMYRSFSQQAVFQGLRTRPRPPDASLHAMETTEMKQPFIPVISVGPFYVRFPRLTNLLLDISTLHVPL